MLINNILKFNNSINYIKLRKTEENSDWDLQPVEIGLTGIPLRWIFNFLLCFIETMLVILHLRFTYTLPILRSYPNLNAGRLSFP